MSTLWQAHLPPFYFHDSVDVPLEASLRPQAQLLPQGLPKLHRPNDAYRPTLSATAAAPPQICPWLPLDLSFVTSPTPQTGLCLVPEAQVLPPRPPNL